MDAFGDAFGPSHNNDIESDPAAEFLAREQSNLAGLVDDTDLLSGTPILNGIHIKEDDFLGDKEGDSGFEIVHHSSVDDNQAGDAAVVVNGFSSEHNLSRNMGRTGPSISPIPSSFSDIPREEPEKIRRWREDQKKRLETKDAEEERKKREMRDAARKELDEWYSVHEEQVGKNRTVNRSAEKELVADTDPIEPGTEWERIAKFCDFNPKASKHQKDISRMRSIILQVKQTPPISSSQHKN